MDVDLSSDFSLDLPLPLSFTSDLFLDEGDNSVPNTAYNGGGFHNFDWELDFAYPANDTFSSLVSTPQQAQRFGSGQPELTQSSLAPIPTNDLSTFEQISLPPTRHQHSSQLLPTKTYAGIDVHEMEINGVTVMRRVGDGWLNATQILKAAGIRKNNRPAILRYELVFGEYEKMQGGSGKYQGTWVCFRRGRELCRRHNVEHLLQPLLETQDLLGQSQLSSLTSHTHHTDADITATSGGTPAHRFAPVDRDQQRLTSHSPVRTPQHQQLESLHSPLRTRQHQLRRSQARSSPSLRQSTLPFLPIDKKSSIHTELQSTKSTPSLRKKSSATSSLRRQTSALVLQNSNRNKELMMHAMAEREE